jgi:hypothetical protein
VQEAARHEFAGDDPGCGLGRVDQSELWSDHGGDRRPQDREVGATEDQTVGPGVLLQDPIEVAMGDRLGDRPADPALLGQRDKQGTGRLDDAGVRAAGQDGPLVGATSDGCPPWQ